MNSLDQKCSAWIPLSDRGQIYIQSMIVIQEREFDGEIIVLGWTSSGMGMFPRKHVYQTKQEASEAGYRGEVLIIPQGAIRTPWFYSLAPQKKLDHFFICPME